MMTELQFLIDLLLNHKLTKPTKDAIASRIKDLGDNPSTQPTPNRPQQAQPQPQLQASFHGAVQSASTAAILARDESYDPAATPIHTIPVVPQQAPVATTPAAAQALADRQNMISQGMSGKGSIAPKLHRGGMKNN